MNDPSITHCLTLTLLPYHLAVCQLRPDTPLPDWAQAEEFLAFIRTPEELSIVCDVKVVPEGVIHVHPWRVLKVHGPLDFSLVGVLASLATPLAEAGISIFTLSTYQTDLILIRENDLDCARQTLNQAGHIITEYTE